MAILALARHKVKFIHLLWQDGFFIDAVHLTIDSSGVRFRDNQTASWPLGAEHVNMGK